ncbi:hypothetical protein [Nocardia gipuzkoensis]|uniref:hypothetical protein n=1 Tax=Nocardia gipuzkoensis TaxID=2749991 RepID=UPI00237E5285|nr:hypothetical protein [Nocardia gipuzkoensis]MDE1673826.1 hypothetical protein [Nocardia gipuzkoensis]
MITLTREAIHAINEYYRLMDASDRAAFFWDLDEEDRLIAQANQFLDQVSVREIIAYDEAAYFASAGEASSRGRCVPSVTRERTVGIKT